MSKPFARLRRFLRELKRRNVYQVAVTYAVVAVGTLQAAKLIFPATTLEGLYNKLVVVAVVGFPLAVVLAWAFEMTPEGVQRTPDAEANGKAEGPVSSGAGGWITALVVVLVAGGGFWYLTAGGGEGPSAKPAPATNTAGTETTRPDTAGPPRIAVLPFENIARDTGDAFFARGMHEEVLNQLSKVSGLGVISRTTMMEMAEADMTAAEIGRKLNADAILEGTVRRAGDRLRITTQLIDAREDAHLWSNTYKRRLQVDQIFQIQADIAERVAGALETQLAEGERQRIEDAPTDDLAAYDAYLKGRSDVHRFFSTGSPAQIDGAIVHFRDAIRRDPGFAEAHARLADAYRMRYTWHSTDRRWLDSAEVALQRARSTDRTIPQIHWVQGFLYVDQDSLDAAAAAFNRALELQPSSAAASSGLSTVRSLQGRLAESVRWAHRAYRLEPGWPIRRNELGLRLQHVGMLDEAEAWRRAALELNPDDVWSVIGLAATQAQTDPEQALNTMEAFLDRHPDHPAALLYAAVSAFWADDPKQAKSYLERIPEAELGPALGWSTFPEQIDRAWIGQMVLGLAELRLGHREQGRRILSKALDAVRATTAPDEIMGSWGLAVWVASGEAALDNREEALQTLERSFGQTAPVPRSILGVWQSLSYPLFDDLRSNPRFQEIV